jgi:hypothetical protein
VVWRILFELCNLRRLFGHGPERVQYLAFGANLSDDIMRERKITPFAARPFTLRDFGLRFNHPAPWVGCGYASAEPAPGERLYGYLYTLSARDAARMDFYEVVPVVRRYRRTWVEQDGETLYFYQTNRSTPALKPTEQYLGYIVDGLRAHPDVDSDTLTRISAIGTGERGKLVSSYLWEQPQDRPPWLRGAVNAYQRMTLVIFFYGIYRFSLTAPFIRH